MLIQNLMNLNNALGIINKIRDAKEDLASVKKINKDLNII